MQVLAVRDGNLGQVDEAELFARFVADRYRETKGPDHSDTLMAEADLGRIFILQGRLDEAGSLLGGAFDRGRRALGEDHPSTLKAAGHLASAFLFAGKPQEAGALLDDALGRMRASLGESDQLTLTATYDMARVRAATGDRAEAVALLSRAVDSGYVFNWVGRNGRVIHGHPGILQDPLLESLHGDPGFEASVGSRSWGAAIDEAVERVRADDPEGAIQSLHLAVDRGCTVPRAIEFNPRFSSLHGDPAFDEVLARARRASEGRNGSR